MYKGFLIDLDGVAYWGQKLIPTCRDFISKCHEKGLKFCFVTNNSSRTVDEVFNHLSLLGYKLTKDNIITSSEVTVNYIVNENKTAKVYLIGMEGIKSELLKHNVTLVDEASDYVVIGLDFQLNYEKLAKACEEIFNGAKFISTNSDFRLSRGNGIAPGNGSLTKVIELVTNVKPIYMGKPQPEMLEYGLKKLGLPKTEVAVIGDNYYTDILGAYNIGVDSIFVETGVMKIKDLQAFSKQPTLIVRNLLELFSKDII
jgi:4-nitrophenyl phosphatase